MSSTYDNSYKKVISDTCAMVGDRNATNLAKQHGLEILNLMWEDAGRYKGSSVGPNITDMTLQVDGHNLPVIRAENFSDKTGDVDPKKFNLLVGNEKGQPLLRVTLYEFLDNLRDFLHDSTTWGGKRCSLIAPARDSHVLVSPQACFLPISKDGTATFNPVLFNYQSQPGDPAVLAILVTREGTSTTILGRPEDQGKLSFNQNGEKASFAGQRKSEWKKTQESSQIPTEEEGTLNQVLLIQVPLKQKNPKFMVEEMASIPKSIGGGGRILKCDVEDAVIGHGEVEGEFNELDGLDIERDDRFPIRVTIQFYKATSNGMISKEAMDEIAAQIEKVYASTDSVGSLVISGETGRVTEYQGNKVKPPNWWAEFWSSHSGSEGFVPDYLLMRQWYFQSHGTSFFPTSREAAEETWKKLSSQRQKQR